MKKFKSIFLTVALSLVFFACEQEVTELKPNVYSPAGTPSGNSCLLYTSPSPRDLSTSRMPSSA